MNNEDDLAIILNTKVAEINDFENKFTSKIESAIKKHDHLQNSKRLQKCRLSITQLEERISKSAASTERLAKLFERLDELKEEENQIINLLSSDSGVSLESEIVNVNLKISITTDESETELSDTCEKHEKEPEIFEENENINSNIISIDNSKNRININVDVDDIELRDAYEIAAHHHIIDDFSNLDFSTRIDEWLACEKFSDWRHNRNFFINRCLQDQISYELTCFDVVPLLNGSYRIPKCLWDELFDYQREGVEWLIKLFEAGNGGVLGDEMGLGKTVQIVAFLAALQISNKFDIPSLIIAPSTLLRQWIRELNTWWPPLRTILLHSSSPVFNETISVKSFLNGNYSKTHVFITSYGTCSSSNLQKSLLALNWNCVVLDEGHKIRNPDSQITLVCKQLKSLRRFALSGTPIQNNLTELWSLFDFVIPGRLGSLPLFKAELASPINTGGYSNASVFQVQTSYKCACTLRDLIKPFLLRRLKRNVLKSGTSANSLPEKREEIVFCKITPYQRKLYETFISSDEVDDIVNRKRNLLAGIDILRKICNHPDLLEHVSYKESEFELYEDEDEDFINRSGDLSSNSNNNLMKSFNFLKKPSDPIERSGKLGVLEKILNLWHKQNHRVLIFCQTRQMLNLIEEFLNFRCKFKYIRMDGTTPIKQRLQLVDKFNSTNSPFFLFLLTTRVGGLGINLTGANRVIIYDPDWNPSTDLQARERVYRLGQTRPVQILRLITAGTIEEKIYHRQIFKQFLTQRILEDPKQTRFFKAADLHDLFELTAEEDDVNDEFVGKKSTETEDMFHGLEEEISRKMNGGRRKNKNKNKNDDDEDEDDGNDFNNLKIKAKEEEDNKKDSDVILNDLLDMIGVHSTLQTTSITETIRPEFLLIQKEAEKIAQGALEALEKSQNRNDNVGGGVVITESDHFNQFKPTWTGRFGSQVKFGSNLNNNNNNNSNNNSNSNSNNSNSNSNNSIEIDISAQDILNAIDQRIRSSTSTTLPDANLKLALNLVDYFTRIRSPIPSDRLAHTFRAQIQGPEGAVVFRSLLKKVAGFDKKKRVWALKEKFIRN